MRTFNRIAIAGTGALLALSLAGTAVASDDAAVARGTTLNVNGQGKVVLNHAEVTAVSASSLTVKVWGSSWTVNVGADTNIVRKFGGSSGTGEIAVGDFVNVRGNIVLGQFAIDATHLKDTSTRAAAFRGTVATVTAPDMLTVTTERGVKTVKVTAATKITMGDATKTFADLAVGQTVNVKGYLTQSSQTVTAASITIRAPRPVPAT